MNNNLPIEIITNILINYLNIYDNKNINKYIENQRKKIIEKHSNIINNYMYKYYMEYMEEADINYLLIPKNIFKKFYPNINKKYHIQNYIELQKKKTIINKKLIEKLTEIHNSINKNNVTTAFNTYIDMANIQDLNEIDWN
jgi:hypothetical protein